MNHVGSNQKGNNMLDMFSQSADVDTSTRDSLGGSALASDVYDFIVKMAYLDTSKGGANSVNLVLETTDKQNLRVTEYVTSGTEKGCKPFYEKDGKKFALPGWSAINSMCLVATGKELKDQTAEDKVLKLYDFELKKETNQTKKALTSLIGKNVTAAVLNVKQDKYSDPTQKINVNEVAKWFNTETRKTKDELAEDKDATFLDAWLTKWKGVEKDETTKVDATAGAASTPDLFA